MSHNRYGTKSHTAAGRRLAAQTIQAKTETKSASITTNPKNGLRNAKKQTLHKKFSSNWNSHNRIKLTSPRTTIVPAEIPISRYNTAHAIGKTIAGGVADDFTRQGYHSRNASPCTYEPSAPTAKVKIIGIKQARNFLIFAIVFSPITAKSAPKRRRGARDVRDFRENREFKEFREFKDQRNTKFTKFIKLPKFTFFSSRHPSIT